MKVRSSRSAAPASAASRAGKAKGSATRPVEAPVSVKDIAAVLGIPEAEFTPKVKAAILSLVQEAERLRIELDSTRKRVTQLEELADQDTLLPVANRRAFVRELSRVMSQVERYNAPHSVLFFDFNGLKRINDSLGHAAGDVALTTVARTLIDNTRESDLVGRLGGDEFGVILAQADQTAANDKAGRLAQLIEAQKVEWRGHRIPLSVAFGTYALKGKENANDALHAADRAMYAHKRAPAARKP
jgi:diguanylate cyclase (GGDEF)-like protein